MQKVETKSDRQKKLKKELNKVCKDLESPWLTPATREDLLEKRKKLSEEAFS